MIKSATALKANVKNIANNNSKMAQAYIRLFFMERFLERVSKSRYKEQFILKGGMLVSSMIGMSLRTTMDIDTSIEALPLSMDKMQEIIDEIINISIEDNVTFEIASIETIMDEFDYPGIRIHMLGHLDKINQPIKIDISTDDVITPKAVEYSYPLMFEKREIALFTYNAETLLAEKMQTILSRGITNTRMRDFYDLYELIQIIDFSWDVYKNAFDKTCEKRKTIYEKEEAMRIMKEVASDSDMENRWGQFRKKNDFVGDIMYKQLMDALMETTNKLFHTSIDRSSYEN
ncbi:MAG: nucleotidyl transferase AbiEii/AbiGii toxin family protein [Lachnospiraceae bacterium]|nr:nucleotidyl transferase AbiEii/AbiGii toxin family protein [Lachnospiraceae bacterium]